MASSNIDRYHIPNVTCRLLCNLDSGRQRSFTSVTSRLIYAKATDYHHQNLPQIRPNGPSLIHDFLKKQVRQLGTPHTARHLDAESVAATPIQLSPTQMLAKDQRNNEFPSRAGRHVICNLLSFRPGPRPDEYPIPSLPLG